jgi:Fe-S-cluster containining protein
VSPENRQRIVEKIQLFGLVFACPFQGDNPNSCQLHEIRELSPQARVEWVRTLSEQQIRDFLEVHRACLCVKQGRAVPPPTAACVEDLIPFTD